MQVAFSVISGHAIFEGDIDLGPVEEIPTTHAQALQRAHTDGVRSMGIVIDGYDKRWPLGRVPYVIDQALPMQYRVNDAIAHIEANNPGVDFVPRAPSDADYIYITPSTVCNSYVGRRGGMQVINLADGCGTGSTIHELLHALGMWHEQSRCDRDGYVQIYLENVQPGYEYAFDRYCSNASDMWSYDERSIMHYHPYAFSRNGLPTLRSLRGLDSLMGQTSGMSALDAYTVRMMYRDPIVCGNGQCQTGETFTTCPVDCQSSCGNLVCESGEAGTCLLDCTVCGDGTCDLSEWVYSSCYWDCGVVVIPTP
ncbi:M12 family metallopeptidase [Hyalangium gracile]|uniref:M12 family metallopeptidase n=1 Tax=Hyalangium gracile TaxID=394092 RepID=UPI001CCF3249|nr:M12 family metallopeptidase [Hyalangium gracile]